jgi:hypothetical protein
MVLFDDSAFPIVKFPQKLFVPLFALLNFGLNVLNANFFFFANATVLLSYK